MNKRKSKNIILYFYILLILFTLTVTASYTWFSISRTPRVSNMGLSVAGQKGLELSFDLKASDEEWSQVLDVRDIIEDTIALKPATWVNSEEKLYTARYGSDGRIINIDKALDDETHSNRDDVDGYYMHTTFYARTGTDVNVSLMPASSNGENVTGTYVIGTPVWNESNIVHNNGGNGAEYTIRVGIKITKLDLNGIEKANSVQFYIYEPNYDGHIDGKTVETQTPSINGDEMLIDEDRLIRQTTTSWSEAYPVEHGVVITKPGEFLTEPHLFKLNPEEYAKIDLIIWMEGQDIDCGYDIGSDAQIMVNIQLDSVAEDQSGIEEFR